MQGDVINTMDPSLNTDVISGQALNDTMEGLYRYKGVTYTPAGTYNYVGASLK